jgi:hypothetical protein
MGLSDVFQSIQKSLSFSKTAEISGIKFELKLLTFEQELNTEALPSDEMDPLTYYNQTRLQTLSYAVSSINGEIVPAIVEIEGSSEKMKGNLYVKKFLGTLPIKVIEQLFEIYIDLKEEVEAKMDKDLKYNWFKTPEQRATEKNKKEPEEKVESPKEQGTAEEDIKLREIKVPPEEDEKPGV